MAKKKMTPLDEALAEVKDQKAGFKKVSLLACDRQKQIKKLTGDISVGERKVAGYIGEIEKLTREREKDHGIIRAMLEEKYLSGNTNWVKIELTKLLEESGQ